MEQKLNIVGEEIKDGVSIFCAAMNREKNLLESLESWLANKLLDEVVIVDWSSDNPLTIEHEKVKIIRVEEEPRWVLTLAFNLAAQFTTRSNICKADCDYILSDTFLNKYKPNENSFFAGNYKLARDWNERFLNGLSYFKRDVFFSVNGYSENILTYGYDDSDLYKRLELNLIRRLDIDPDDAKHIEHSNKARGLSENFWDAPFSGFDKNIEISKNMFWCNESKSSQYHILKNGQRSYTCKRILKQ